MRHRPRRSHRHGISLMLVTAFVAAASVMGLALLSSAALQAAATRNQDLVVQADGLAESGINLGTYWVQNLGDPAKCPAAVTGLAVGAKANQNNLTIKGVPGKIKVTVERLSYNRYQVTAVGNSKSVNGESIPRTLAAQVDANYFGFALSATNLTSSSLAIPASTRIDGDVFANVPVTTAPGATVNGTVYDAPPSSSGGGGLLGGVLNAVTGTLNAVVATLVPTPATANHYPSYSYNNKTYAAAPLPDTVSNTTLNPDPQTNPLGIFAHRGPLTLAGNATINGTVVVQDKVEKVLLVTVTTPGTLKVTGKGNTISQAAPNYPALVVDAGISFDANAATLDVTGLAYNGGGVARTNGATGTALNVVGALLFGGTSASLDPNVPIHLTYGRARASVPSLVTSGTPAPTSVTVVYWKN